jgi:hypothetical protein
MSSLAAHRVPFARNPSLETIGREVDQIRGRLGIGGDALDRTRAPSAAKRQSAQIETFV